jgi:uncharacterized protein (DUF362 family)
VSLVSLIQARKLDSNTVKNSIGNALTAINYSIRDHVKSVVVKLNLCYYWDYSTGQTTDPRFITALIDLIRAKTSPHVDIALLESDASAMRCKHVFRMLGYEKLAEEYGVKLVNLSEMPCDPVSVTCGNASFRFPVPKIIRDANLRISVSKIKYTMEPIKLTCALKNTFGCIPYSKKFKYHQHLGETIVAVNKAMPFNLFLIDGLIVSGAQPRKLGLVMASQDPVAMDVAAAEIAGINPKKIAYLRLASKEGLGKTAYIALGTPIEHFKQLYPKRDVKKLLMTKGFLLVNRLRLAGKLGL